MAASVWKCCMTAAVKVKHLSPSFSGKSHLTQDTDQPKHLFWWDFQYLWYFHSVFRRHQYIWVAANTVINPHEQTACSRYYFVRWRVAVRACFNALVLITVFQRDFNCVWFSVPAARRWLLSAAYTDAKVWEAREKDPQSLGKSFTALSLTCILNAINSSVSSVWSIFWKGAIIMVA